MPYRTALSTYDAVNNIFLTDITMAVIGTYTIDNDYVSTTDLNGFLYLKEGWVMALNPANSKIVPNYTSYGFGVIGVLPAPASLQNIITEHDEVVGLVMDSAWLDEDLCFDNGVFGTVLDATKTTLSGRIVFASSL